MPPRLGWVISGTFAGMLVDFPLLAAQSYCFFSMPIPRCQARQGTLGGALLPSAPGKGPRPLTVVDRPWASPALPNLHFY